MKYFKKLSGDKCYLSPISLDDAERFTEWVNDMEMGLFMLFSTDVFDLDKERELLMQIRRNNVSFAIVEKATDEAIGICGLVNVDMVHRHANFGIFIGDKAWWNKGIGTEATQLILDHAFNNLNLNNVSLEVYAFNQRAISCYEKVGFKFAGRRRKFIFKAGSFHDVLIYDILAEEFSSPRVKDIFARATGKDNSQ
ncbi:MAG: GNAT family N-acetyltransferase [Candidatus Cloacimonetes bacterium]|nr:GNAT family N-acetyltransferase [Candidatus Cloacimonadota bacterium]